jgi:hypothetical protein
MARNKKQTKIAKAALHALKFPNLPTAERAKWGDVSIRNNIGLVDDPLRIDKLLRNGIIDEMQHLYGMQIITYWHIANRPFIRTASYEQRIGRVVGNFEFINITRMSAEDKFYKTFAFLSERDRGLISKICFDELPAIEAGKSLGLPINSITVYVRNAFDNLGEALSKMRDFRKTMEKTEEVQVY